MKWPQLIFALFVGCVDIKPTGADTDPESTSIWESLGTDTKAFVERTCGELADEAGVVISECRVVTAYYARADHGTGWIDVTEQLSYDVDMRVVSIDMEVCKDGGIVQLYYTFVEATDDPC